MGGGLKRSFPFCQIPLLSRKSVRSTLHQRYWRKTFPYLYKISVWCGSVQAPYIEGALEFLKKHYQQIPLFVASGTPEPELREIIKHRSIPHFFQGVYGSPATKTEILQRILAECQFNPEQILMVGDALTDWEGAQGVGAEFIGIQSGKSSNIFPSTKILLNNFVELDKCVYQN
mgnify:CR=1 FL=1